jgi:Flp pilus assembly protein TadG
MSAGLIFLALFLVVYAARSTEADTRVDDAAQAAARAASQSHSAAAAQLAGQAAANEALAERGVSCRSAVVAVDLSDYRPGGSVTATVSCAMDRAELALLGLGGSRQVSARFSSPVDVAATAARP